MAHRTRLLAVAFCLFSVERAWPLDPHRAITQYVHRIFQAQEGLPESSIYSIWQTRQGYLWLGTQNGAARFDGVTFTPAPKVFPGLPANLWIRDGFEDAEGAIWLATNDSGIFRVHNGAVRRYSTKDGLPSDTVICLTAMRDGGTLACTDNGLARIRAGQIHPYPGNVGLVQDACEASGGKIWISRFVGPPMYWDGTRFIAEPLRSVPRSTGARSILCAADGVWIGSTGGLVHIQGSRQRLYTVQDGLPDQEVLTLLQGRDGALWIGTRDGFSRYRNGRFDHFRSGDGLSQSNVMALFEDREGSLWVGTKEGLNQFLDGRAVLYTTQEGLPSNNAGPVLEDREGRIWAGTLDAGLVRLEGGSFRTITTKDGLASNAVHAMYQDVKGTLWAGTSRGLSRIQNGRIAAPLTMRDGLPSDDVRSFYLDHEGGLWVGTAAGLAKWVEGRFAAAPGGPRVAIHGIAEDHLGRLIVTSEQGIYRRERGGFQELGQPRMSLRAASSIFRDPDGLVWVGTTRTGLRLIDKSGKITGFYVRDGLYDSGIYGFLLDDHDRLWMSCSKGIFWVRRADLLRFAEGAIKSFESTPYSRRESLRVVEGTPNVQPVAAKARKGQLWFSTKRGLIVLDQDRLQLNTPPPPVVIEDPVVNGRSVRPDLVSQLPPGSNNLRFTYAGLSYIAPTQLRFRYMLEGYDSQWTDAGTRREAFYTNLPPGTFRFRVATCNPEGVCNGNSPPVEFSLAPHLYQRAWFPLSIVALVLAAAVAAYRLRIRRLRERYDLIVSERSRIARELHDTLIQGFSGVTMALQAVTSRLRSPEERAELQEIVDDAARCLRETRRSVAGLRGVQGAQSGLPQALAEAAREITATQDVKLKLKLDQAPHPLPPEIEYNLLRIAVEAVTNSVKHSGAGSIEVTLRFAAGCLRLIVADDGSGLERPQRANGESGHYGLIGMRERAAQIGAKFEMQSGPGLGTRVLLELPLSGQTAAAEMVR
jgi:signal transduction histidine kinase/ligand-binding sensor domain-containing protein